MERIQMEIKIETSFTPLISACDDLPEGVSLIRQRAIEKRYLGDVSAIVVLSLLSGVPASMIGNWIYYKIKKVKDKPQFWIKIKKRGRWYKCNFNYLARSKKRA